MQSRRRSPDGYFEKIADRIITKVSVGYVVHVAEETTADSVGVPTLRAIDWEPFEVSAVAVGADDGATFRSTEQFHTTRVQRGERKHMDPEVDPKQPSPQPSIVETEKQRAIQIRHAVKVANLPAEYAERMISDGLTPEAARLQAFAALEARGNDINPTPGRADIEDEPRSTITVGDVPEDHFVRGASAWLLEKTGKREIVRKAQAAKARGFENIAFDGGRFRGMSMLELAKESIRLRGGKIRSFDSTRIIGDALQVRGWNGLGAHGTGDFSNLLANVLNKVLMAQYALAPATWRAWCAEMSNQDFRAATHLQTGAFPTLPVVKEHEEYKHLQIPDASKIEVSTETRGGIMAISRQALVNDDMGYFTNFAQQMGLAAARSIESAAYAMLLENSGLGPTINGNPFFHSSRANVGSAAQLSVAALDADRVLMTAQKDVNGIESLDLRPSVLLVPSSIGGLARAIVKAELEPELLQMPNRVEGLANVVDTGRLTGTRRYIFAGGRFLLPALLMSCAAVPGSRPSPTQREAPLAIAQEQRGGASVSVEWMAQACRRATLEVEAALQSPFSCSSHKDCVVASAMPLDIGCCRVVSREWHERGDGNRLMRELYLRCGVQDYYCAPCVPRCVSNECVIVK